MKLIGSLTKLVSGCALLLGLTSCAHVLEHFAPRHPLAGKIWDVAAQRFVDPSLLMERAAAARYVLLGEIHDNADHHRIQAAVFDAMLQRGRRPALVMEQYDVEQQAKVNAIVQGMQAPDEKLRGLGELMRTGWEWRYYQPLVNRGLREKLPLIAANLSRDTLRLVARNGYEALGAGEESRLALASAWSDERDRQLLDEVAHSHCGKIPEHVLQSISKSQRARDAMMADMLLMAKRSGAVAIVGRGHARQDLGVPLYLAARAPEDPVVSIGLIEVDRSTDPAAYAYGPLGRRHDYLWFTGHPRRRADPCESIPVAKPAARD